MQKTQLSLHMPTILRILSSEQILAVSSSFIPKVVEMKSMVSLSALLHLSNLYPICRVSLVPFALKVIEYELALALST